MEVLPELAPPFNMITVGATVSSVVVVPLLTEVSALAQQPATPCWHG